MARRILLSSATRWNRPHLQFPRPSTARWFRTEAQFHAAADETLDALLDSLEEFVDPLPPPADVALDSGVLTLTLPTPRAPMTWVVNKQAPNRQLWWSSPLSGPNRCEFEEERWVFTRTEKGGFRGWTLEEVLLREIDTVLERGELD